MTGGFSSDTLPRSFAYPLSVTDFTTAPHVESSSFTSSFSSATVFSGTEGFATSRFGSCAGTEAATAGALVASDTAGAAGALVAAIAACSARYLWRSFARPISLQMYHARTAPSKTHMSFSVLFIFVVGH